MIESDVILRHAVRYVAQESIYAPNAKRHIMQVHRWCEDQFGERARGSYFNHETPQKGAEVVMWAAEPTWAMNRERAFFFHEAHAVAFKMRWGIAS